MKNYLTQNKKMKAMSGRRTFNWGIPAYKEKGGKLTCPMADKCVKGCYATQGAYIWSNVSQAFQARYDLSLTNNFVDVISAEIKKRKIERVRIHDSGDFYSPAYLSKWIEIIKQNPTVEFYAYTKMVKLFKTIDNIPTNFTVIYSFGGKQDNLIDTNTDRHSQVFDNINDLIKAGYIDASKDDNNAVLDNKKVGLIYHGARSKAWVTKGKTKEQKFNERMDYLTSPNSETYWSS